MATLGDRDVSCARRWEGAFGPRCGLREPIERAAEATLRACDGLREAVGSADGLRQAFRALRQVSRAHGGAVSAGRGDAGGEPVLPAAACDQRCWPPTTGSRPTADRRHARRNTTGERGGFSVYVPEDYDPSRRYPLVMALHGGSGHGRLFLWSWLREVRGRGVILAAPTAIGDTWSLMEPQVDSANLVARAGADRAALAPGSDASAADRHERRRHVHAAERTGRGLAVHPSGAGRRELSSAAADDGRPRRVAGLPVYLVHGAMDWMFPCRSRARRSVR